MAEKYQYKPLRFYVACFAATWVFWIAAAFISGSENDNGLSLLLMLFGQSLGQFAFTEGFSFADGGLSALMTILLAAVIEEVGWRGYGEDSVAFHFSWFTESVIFGCVWTARINAL